MRTSERVALKKEPNARNSSPGETPTILVRDLIIHDMQLLGWLVGSYCNCCLVTNKWWVTHGKCPRLVVHGINLFPI